MKIDPVQSYLEMARAHLHAEKIDKDGNQVTEDLPPIPMLAIVSQGYIYSFAALNAFLTGQLSLYWETTLKAKYKKHNSLEHLLKTELKELKCMCNELSDCLGIPRIHDANSALWNQLLQILKTARDFFVHPIPDIEKMGKVIDTTMIKNSWSFPSDIAAEVIKFFYTQKGKSVPEFLTKRQHFRYTQICLNT